MKTISTEPSLLGFVAYLQDTPWSLLLVAPMALAVAWVLAEKDY